MIKALEVDKKFEETIRKFITDHEDEFRKKYKNTLALNNETRFKELENCRNENDVETKLYDITFSNRSPASSEELLITDARNSEVIKFKKQRSEIRDKVKKLICEIMSIALTGKPNARVDVSDLYQNNSNIPLKKFLPLENTSLSVDMLKEALKVELGGSKYNEIDSDKKNSDKKRLNYLWKEVLMIIGDMLDGVENDIEKMTRLKNIQDRLKSFDIDMFGEKWHPLKKKEISNLDYKIQTGRETRGQKLKSDKQNHEPDENSLNSVKGKQIKDNSNWAKIMTNFMITILKVNKSFAETIEEFFTTNAKELKKPGKYPNTLALNKEPRFVELKTCKSAEQVKKKLEEITGVMSK